MVPPSHDVGKNTTSNNIYYVTQASEIPYFKGYQNCINSSKVTAILKDAWILPIGGVAPARVCDQRGYPK